MKILGIDPGVGRLGWAVIDHTKGVASYLDCGCLETTPKSELPDRLEKIYLFLQQLIITHKPDEIAAESLFFTNNAKTAFDVGAARGVILLCSKLAHIPISQYTPLQVKSSLTGYGKAEKSQVEFMVVRMLKLKEIPKLDDAVDALAIALTHTFHKKAN